MQREEKTRGLECNSLKYQPLLTILLVIGFGHLNHFGSFSLGSGSFWPAIGFKGAFSYFELPLKILILKRGAIANLRYLKRNSFYDTK